MSRSRAARRTWQAEMRDDQFESEFRECLRGASRSFDRGEQAEAARDAVMAAAVAWSSFRRTQDAEPDRYRAAWEGLARMLLRLPPSLLRRAVTLLDEQTT